MTRYLAGCLLAGTLFGAGPSAAQPSDHGNIAPLLIGPAKSGVNQWTRYRKSFTLDQVPEKAGTTIAVDSKYWLWINGGLVVREGGLKRGPNPTGTYFDRLDLAPHLKKGGNTVAVLVWHFGKNGFSHHDSGQAGLVFSLDLGDRTLTSDGSWKISPHPAVSTSPGTAPNRRLPESSLLFDARLDDPSWTTADYQEESWSPPAVFSSPPDAPWGKLSERPIPLWKDYGLKDYHDAPALPFNSTGSEIKVRLPYNSQVTPWLKVEAASGLEIDIRTDNFNGGGESNIHSKYITCDGVQEFEALGWMNGHEVIYQMPAGVKVIGLKYRETGYDTGFTGSFDSSDPDLDLLWKKAARTLYITMRDSYMDCPDRERAQWWGDSVNELGEIFYTFDPRGSLLTKKAIRELADWQRDDGTLYSPVPAGIPVNRNRKDAGGSTWYSELPVQMLASVGKYGFWTYYFHSGDADTIRHVYPAVKRYLELWNFDEDGLIIHRAGDWNWSDWGKDIDARAIDSAWYYLCMEGAINMAKLTGHDADMAEWQRRRDRIFQNYNRLLWTGSEYRSPGYKGDTDDRANGLAVVAGLATPEQYPALKKVFSGHHNASPYMEKYVIEALYQIGEPDLAMARMKMRYRKQIDSPLTTLWEGWGLGKEGYGGGTYNHAWSGGPLTCLSQYAAGVAPTKAGYETYSVLPQLGSLQRIGAVVPSVRGEIKLVLQQSDARFIVEITSPPGASGVVGIPKREGKSIEIVGAALKSAGEDPRYLLFQIEPGHHRIEAEYSN